MKKVALILLLFYAKTVAAQQLYVGIDAGGTHYAARQFNKTFYPEENYLALVYNTFLKAIGLAILAILTMYPLILMNL